MPTHDRRAVARRRAWGRGPIILRFEPLEGRQLLSTTQPLPDLAASAFETPHNLDWGDSFDAVGQISNQGAATAANPFLVNIYASSTPSVGPGSVLIGQATIPAGLAPGQTVPFDQKVSLPQTPVPGQGASPTVYVGLVVDPNNVIPESNKSNNAGVGLHYDTSVVTITPHLPAHLIGTSLGIYPDQAVWGGTVSVTAQIRNNAAGDAPPTRARIVLTPLGQTPGGTSDVTVGSLNVPAVPAWQTVNLVQDITLPAAAPVPLGGATQFTLTMVQDADFVTTPLFPPPTVQGLGLDQTSLRIDPGPNANVPQGSLPQLAAGSVVAPSNSIAWGQSFQVATSVQNIGRGDAGPFHVQFLLVGASGSLDHALVLGGANVPSLKAGYNQDIIQTLKLPGRLPAGLTLSSAGVGQIAVVVDPENMVNETYHNNRVAQSAPIVLRVLGTDGTSTVPTLPASKGLVTPVQTTSPKPNPNAVGRNGKLHRTIPPPQHHSITYNIEHNLKIFPSHTVRWIKKIIKNKKK